MNESYWSLVFVCPGDRLRGNEEELAAAVGAVGVEEGDLDWPKKWWIKKEDLQKDYLGLLRLYCCISLQGVK